MLDWKITGAYRGDSNGRLEEVAQVKAVIQGGSGENRNNRRFEGGHRFKAMTHQSWDYGQDGGDRGWT